MPGTPFVLGIVVYDTDGTTALASVKVTIRNESTNETLYISGSTAGYDIIIINVTIFIDKIPTQVTLQNVDPVYTEGDVSILATMEKIIEIGNPKPNNYGDLTCYIYDNYTQKLSGSLNFLMNGVYLQNVVVWI